MSNKDNNHIVDTNKKISSVEWLIKKLINRQNGVFDGFPHLSLDEIFAQAKAMHKAEVKKHFNDGYENGADNWGDGSGKTAEQYYNENYGK